MKPVPSPRFCLEVGVGWMARVLAVLLVGMVLLFLVGERFNPFKLTRFEAILMAFHLITWVGLAIAWRWPFLGGAMAVAGIVLYYAVDIVVTGRFLNNLSFDLMLLAGLLFLFSALIRPKGDAVPEK